MFLTGVKGGRGGVVHVPAAVRHGRDVHHVALAAAQPADLAAGALAATRQL